MTGTKKHFTLIEMLVVISIIAILIALLMPALQSARSSAIGALCLSKMRGVGQMIGLYSSDHRGLVPPTCGSGAGSKWYVAYFTAGYIESFTISSGVDSGKLGTYWNELKCPGMPNPYTNSNRVPTLDVHDNLDYGCCATQVLQVYKGYNSHTINKDVCPKGYIPMRQMKRPDVQLYAGDCYRDNTKEKGFYSLWLHKGPALNGSSAWDKGRVAGRHNHMANFVTFGGAGKAFRIDDEDNPGLSNPFFSKAPDYKRICTNE